ncbi:hypothetical protein LguiB_000667 [Lonicera macranthoides]
MKIKFLLELRKIMRLERSHLRGKPMMVLMRNVTGEISNPSTSDGLHGSRTTMQNLSSKLENVVTSEDLKPSEPKRRGSAGVVGSMMLLKSHQYMHAPFTQEAPIMTEDMHEERLRAVEAFGDSFSFSAQLEKDILLSDMSAFKAANPSAVFEDFIRWHSPKDWENDDIKENDTVSQSHSMKGFEKVWPPKGRLSERMSDYGNSWRKIWNDAPALPASEQKPLLDPNQEGEKILHYLETLRPHQLLEQMVCTAFRAAADTLNQTSFGDLKQMTTKIAQLYLTISSALRPLHGVSERKAKVRAPDLFSLLVSYTKGRTIPSVLRFALYRAEAGIPAHSFGFIQSGEGKESVHEVTEDLRRLCGVFEHVEKLLTVAASLHRKFLQAPRLSEAIFSDFFNFYLPKMGTGSVTRNANKEFESKQEVRIHEREVIASMFTQPTANQSWRKVLSMGNLLNGHEPTMREIIFSIRDRMSGSSYYAARTPWGHEQEIETYRMYICGTSNDLGVALSVASCD